MASVKWRPTKLDELGHVGRGKSKHRPRNDAILYGGRYPFFQTGDIKAANFYLTEYSQTYSEKGLAQSKLWKPGTLCITIAANIAESAILGVEGCFPDSVVGFVPDTSKADVRFIKYYLEILKLRMQNISHGSTQDNLSLDKLLSFDFLVPPLITQRRIADILSAYDELIENSQRRIKVLEEMARALYREWFVHFRFPGHESVPRVPSPLGDIPQGWEVKRIDDALSFESGRTIKKEDRENGDTPVYGANGIIGGTTNSPMANECIIMGKIGSCGALHRSQKPCWVTNNAFLIRPAAIQSLELAWQLLLGIDFRQYVGGAANPYMPINTFGQHEVLVAPEELQVAFQGRAAPLRRLVEMLSERSDNLRRTRDLLLPRLLSGQIEVKATVS